MFLQVFQTGLSDVGNLAQCELILSGSDHSYCQSRLPVVDEDAVDRLISQASLQMALLVLLRLLRTHSHKNFGKPTRDYEGCFQLAFMESEVVSTESTSGCIFEIGLAAKISKADL